MRCEACQGTGFAEIKCGACGRPMDWKLPCDECDGSGIAYCCGDAGINPPNAFDQVKPDDEGGVASDPSSQR